MINSLSDNMSFQEKYQKIEDMEITKNQGCKKFICPLNFCKKEFTQLCSLQIHNLIHRGEKPYECKICGYAFTQLCNLKRHEKFHTGEKSYICNHCFKEFSTNTNLKQHLQTHEDASKRSKYFCPVCSKSYLHQSSLRKHHKEEHQNSLKVEVTFTYDYDYALKEEVFSSLTIKKITKNETE